MRRRSFYSLAVVAALTVAPCFVVAQELLTNGGLELVPPDAGGPYKSPPGWTLVEGPLVPSLPASDPTLGNNNPYLGDYNDSGVEDIPCPGILCGAVDAADYVLWRKQLGGPSTLANRHPNFAGQPNVFPAEYNIWRSRFGYPYVMDLAQPSNFSHLIFEGDWQVWFEPFNATEANAEDNFAHLMQTVPGTPGLQYTMTGYALFEDYFPGGVDNLNAAPGGTPSGAPFNDGPLSPTDSFFGLDFLDANGAVLSSFEKELKADGQPSNTTWMQHTLIGIAPAGTVNVRVRATMLDGVYNPLPSPQVFQMSFFVDLFSLTATTPGAGSASTIPEPSTALLSALAIVGPISALRFRSNARRRREGVDRE